MGRFTKSTYVLAANEKWPMQKLVNVQVKNIVKADGVPLTIVSDRDNQFTSKFKKALHDKMGTKLYMSTTYHTKTDS